MMDQIAENLTKLRKESGLSQEQLAARLYVSRQAVGKWERAEGLPDIENLLLLSRLYGVSMDSLLNLASDGESADEAKLNENKRTKKKNIWREILKISVAAVMGAAIGFFAFGLGVSALLKGGDVEYEQNAVAYYVLVTGEAGETADGCYTVTVAEEDGEIVYVWYLGNH